MLKPIKAPPFPPLSLWMDEAHMDAYLKDNDVEVQARNWNAVRGLDGIKRFYTQGPMVSVNGWQLTDADTHQYRRHLGGRRYELAHIWRLPEVQMYIVCAAVINVGYYNPSELQAHLAHYEACSLEEYESRHGEEADGLLAEMLFEDLGPGKHEYAVELTDPNAAEWVLYLYLMGIKVAQ